MPRPLAKKKLQDHVQEYLNNYSPEMKMEKAVEIRRENIPELLRPDIVVWAISLSCDFDSVAQDRVGELLVECRQQRPPVMTSKSLCVGWNLPLGGSQTWRRTALWPKRSCPTLRRFAETASAGTKMTKPARRSAWPPRADSESGSGWRLHCCCRREG